MLDEGMENHQERLTGLSGCLSTCHLNKVSEQPESASLCCPRRLGEVSVALAWRCRRQPGFLQSGLRNQQSG